MVVPFTPASLRRWENPEDMDIHEVSGGVLALFVNYFHIFTFFKCTTHFGRQVIKSCSQKVKAFQFQVNTWFLLRSGLGLGLSMWWLWLKLPCPSKKNTVLLKIHYFSPKHTGTSYKNHLYDQYMFIFIMFIECFLFNFWQC